MLRELKGSYSGNFLFILFINDLANIFDFSVYLFLLTNDAYMFLVVEFPFNEL